MTSISVEIGQKIRTARKKKGLTLTELSKFSHCSASLISAIERGVANPSFIIVKGITDALGVLPSQFLTENGEISTENKAISTLIKRSNRKVMIMGRVRFELVCKGPNVPFEFVLCDYEPGASTEQLLTHEGQECGLLLEGELHVEFEDVIHYLEPGDSISFSSSVPHRVSNKGKKKAVAYWINSIPWLFSTK